MSEFGLEAGGDATVSMEMGPRGVTWWTPSNSALWWPAAMANMGQCRADDVKRAVGAAATWAKDIAMRGMEVRQADTSLFNYKRVVRHKRGAEPH